MSADKAVIATLRSVRIMDPAEAEENERQYREWNRQVRWQCAFAIVLGLFSGFLWALR
jgi:hypothetical protein